MPFAILQRASTSYHHERTFVKRFLFYREIKSQVMPPKKETFSLGGVNRNTCLLT